MSVLILTLFAFLLGLLAAFLLLRSREGTASNDSVISPHGDYPLLLDLLRRAHGAAAVCLALPDRDPIWAMTYPRPAAEVLDRTLAVARLAMGDGRDHVLRDGETVIAAGDGSSVGGAVVIYSVDVDSALSDAIITDLRKIVADMGVQLVGTQGAEKVVSNLPEWLAGGPESVEGISFQLCEAALEVTGYPSVLVIRDTATQMVTVVAVSAGADRRLLGAAVSSKAAMGRACHSDVPIVGANSQEFFGTLRADRRRQTTGGIAFPLWDGRECVGALGVFAENATLGPASRDQLQWLVKNAGPRLGRAVALRNAETRALTDELTGLPNRRALERAMRSQLCSPCSVLLVDLDHFKLLNDTHGHAAGDAALRHVADVFRSTLRSCDLPARIGGEEFALWLPGAPANQALEIAGRVREALKRSPLASVGGEEVRITCSIGVASVPETVTHVDNLMGAADVAMYRAKELGRDRVEVAQPGTTE